MIEYILVGAILVIIYKFRYAIKRMDSMEDDLRILMGKYNTNNKKFESRRVEKIGFSSIKRRKNRQS